MKSVTLAVNNWLSLAVLFAFLWLGKRLFPVVELGGEGENVVCAYFATNEKYLPKVKGE